MQENERKKISGDDNLPQDEPYFAVIHFYACLPSGCRLKVSQETGAQTRASRRTHLVPKRPGRNRLSLRPSR